MGHKLPAQNPGGKESFFVVLTKCLRYDPGAAATGTDTASTFIDCNGFERRRKYPQLELHSETSQDDLR